MQRYFIKEEALLENDMIQVTGDDAHHMTKVMRMEEGNEVIINFPTNDAYICSIVTIDQNNVRLQKKEPLKEEKELPLNITIAQGLPKGSKLEWIVQKGTELGASAFTLVQMDRSVAKWDEKTTKKKLPRYEKIMKEASEQCHRTSIPTISGTFTIEKILESVDMYDRILFAYEEEAKGDTSASLYPAMQKMKKGERILFFIGPEGGFSEREVSLLKEYGASAVRLGKRILRTETASLYALAAMSFYFEEQMTE